MVPGMPYNNHGCDVEIGDSNHLNDSGMNAQPSVCRKNFHKDLGNHDYIIQGNFWMA